MKNRKLIGIILTVVGIALLPASLLADSIGIGGAAGFGWKQAVGAVAGLACVVAGLILFIRK